MDALWAYEMHQKLASTCKLKLKKKKLIEISDFEDISIKDEHIKSVRSTYQSIEKLNSIFT